MGTSKSIGSPTGGKWSKVRSEVTSHFSGTREITPGRLVSSLVDTVGGIGVSRKGGAGVGLGIAAGLAGIGSFGATAKNEGLTEALEGLELSELVGKPAVEVIGAIAEHLAESADGLDRELVAKALREALLEAAGLSDGLEYDDLETSLASFLAQDGVDGLVELYLARFVFDALWVNIEAHVQERSPDEDSFEALMRAIEQRCHEAVTTAMDEAKQDQRFDQIDWIGPEGRKLARSIAGEIGRQLAMAEDEAE